MRKSRGGKKFSSSLELGPEKAEFLKELNNDISETSVLSKKFAPGSNFAKQDCPPNVSATVCGSVENDRRRLLGNLYGVFSTELKMLTALRDCTSMSLRFFECKTTAVSCPMSGIMNGLPFGGNRAQFDQIYSGILVGNKLKSDGDICRQKREYYEGRLKEYRGKHEGGPQTPAEKVKLAEKAKADALITELQAKLKAADEAVISSAEAVSAVKEKISGLEKKYDEESKACSGKDCQPEITIAHNDWEISAEPKMPSDFTATANVANAEWTFQASWHYNTVHCNYPTAPNPINGVVFNPTKYAKVDILGGDYKLTLKSKCKDGSKEVSSVGVITGSNPSRETIINEIRNLGGEDNLEILTKIACLESGITQFLKGGKTDCPGKPGMPYACNPNDFGIFQITDDTNRSEHCKAAWNWKYNVAQGVTIWKRGLKNAKQHNISEMQTIDKTEINKELQTCIFKGIELSISNFIKSNAISETDAVLLATNIQDALIDVGKMSAKYEKRLFRVCCA